VLTLDDNRITGKGGRQILKAVKQNSNIVKVTFEGNEIGHRVTNELRSCLRRSKQQREEQSQKIRREIAIEDQGRVYENFLTVVTIAGVGGLAFWIMRRKPHDMGNRYVVWNRH